MVNIREDFLAQLDWMREQEMQFNWVVDVLSLGNDITYLLVNFVSVSCI